MGLSMLAGLIGTVLYGSYCVKNDIQAITTDNSIKPTLNQKDNERKLRINFEAICKRCNVKLDKKTKNPFKESDYKLCTEYLKYQGYDNNAIKYFEKIFKEKANNKKQGKTAKINIKHSQLKNKYKNSTREHVLVTFKKHQYKDSNPTMRMNKLMENELWNTIVHNYTYVNDGYGKYCEIWNLKVPKNFFSNYNIDDLYNEVCWKQGLTNGTFMS